MNVISSGKFQVESIFSGTYTIVIDDFRKKLAAATVGGCTTTEEFTVNWTKFHIEFYIAGGNKEYKGYLSLFLHNRSDWMVRARMKISVKGDVFRPSKEFELVYDGKDLLKESWGRGKCIPHSRCVVGDLLCPGGTLTIQVKIDLLGENCSGGIQDQTGLKHKLDEQDAKLDRQDTELSEIKSKLMKIEENQVGPDQKEQEEMKKIQIPNEIFTKILMKLDGRSLHTARQVSKEWNSVIEAQVLGTVEGRRQMERTLQLQWREAAPARSEVTIGGLINPSVLIFTDQFALINSKQPNPQPNSTHKLSLFNTRDGVEVPGLCCLADHFFGALISKDVFLVVKVRWFAWHREREVLAWNINTKERIFYEKFPNIEAVFDHDNQQVMLGRYTRLKITGTTVTEIIQASLPRDSHLLVFSHPYYLTSGLGTLWKLATFWKLDGTQFIRVGDLDHGYCWTSMFCLAREILVNYYRIGTRMTLRVFSTQTGQLIKERVLSVFSAFPRHNLTPHSSFLTHNLARLNFNQLVVIKESQDAMLVYDLDTLLSQLADQQISPRRFVIDQSNFLKVYLNKTLITAVLQVKDTMKIITLDFWNAKN